jgi:hypothetical protein
MGLKGQPLPTAPGITTSRGAINIDSGETKAQQLSGRTWSPKQNFPYFL